MTLGEKIKLIRKNAMLTQAEFAAKLHVTGSYISELEKGKKIPSDTLCDMIVMKFNVTKEFWDTREGEIFKDKPPVQEGLSPEKRYLLDAIHDVERNLPEMADETAEEAARLLRKLLRERQ